MAKYFRQITLSLLVVMLSILSIGCGSQVRGDSLFEVSGKSAVNWADQYNRTDPPSLTVYIETDSYAEEPHQISSPAVINQVFEALSDVTIGKKGEADASDTTYTFCFTNADGSKQNFVLLADDCVRIKDTIYEAEGIDDVFTAAYITILENTLDPSDLNSSENPAEITPSSSEDTGDEDSSPVPDTSSDTQGNYAVFSSPEMGFSFLYLPSYAAQMTTGGGAVIYTGGVQGVPFFQVIRVVNGPSAEQYLSEQRMSIQIQFEDQLVLDEGEPVSLGVEGRDIYGIQLAYTEEDSDKIRIVTSFAENLEDRSVAVFTASFYDDDEAASDAIMAALTDALNSFMPDAGYYTGGSSGNNNNNPAGEPSAPSSGSQTASYTLENYDGGIFTMKLPKGFVIETAGAYAGFGFHAYDPQNPDVQIFFYGELGPYFRSAEDKSMYQQYSQSGDPLTKLSVLNPKTVLGCISSFDDYEQAYNATSTPYHDFPVIRQLSNISEQPVTTFLSGVAESESMVLADLTSTTGNACSGIFQGSIADANPYASSFPSPSVCAMDVFGVIAPKEQFTSVSPALIESLCSFRFTDEYIKESMSITNTIGMNAAEYSRQNEAMMDNITNNFLNYINERY